MNVAIIPARGGSKRIPLKNIRNFCGKPMIAWSILAAQKSGCFDRIIVSTDDESVAQIAKKYGAEVPFVRPEYLSNDTASTLPVIRHAIEWLRAEAEQIEYVCCLYATAPFVQADDLIKGFEQLRADNSLDFTFSVTSFPFPIQRAIYIDEQTGQTRMFQPECEEMRSQDLIESFHDAGQFYWGTPRAFIEKGGIFTARSTPIILPRHRVQDIDTEEDWTRAEILFRLLNETN